ncbi:MAG: hypothetical protein QXS54_11405 [Candidatus Methanomethylicaceae archaeon]
MFKRENQKFSPLFFRASDDMLRGEIEGHIALIERLRLGSERYGAYAYRNPENIGRGRWSVDEIIAHAVEHLNKLRLGIQDDAGPDPRHHVGAVMVACHILSYYTEHYPEIFGSIDLSDDLLYKLECEQKRGEEDRAATRS